MTPDEQKALMSIVLLAAFADGGKDEHEREAVRRVAASLDPSLNTPALLQDVLLARVTMAQAASALTTQQSRQLAF